MSFDEREDVNVSLTTLSDFFTDFKGQLGLVTGLIDMPEDLTLEDIRKPMLVLGDPGIGKTAGIISIISDMNNQLPQDKQLGFKKIQLGQTVVGALSGIPIADGKGGVHNVYSTALPTVEKDGEYGVLFLDEITTANEAQVQPALGLADDSRSIEGYKLPEHWVVVAAGNGPNCSNFVRLDDMTLTRFTCYDIKYDYKKDWRPWAHENNVDPLILAFLNFNNDAILDIVSTDMDKAGKMCANPRTWTRLNNDLKVRKATGREVKGSELYGFSSRIVGMKSAREFSAFYSFKDKVQYNADDIINGTSPLCAEPMETEVFHILLQSITGKLKRIVDKSHDGMGNFPLETYQKVANAMTWILDLKKFMLESVINGCLELFNEIENIKLILSDDDFTPLCPAWDKFFEDHASLILQLDI